MPLHTLETLHNNTQPKTHQQTEHTAETTAASQNSVRPGGHTTSYMTRAGE